jgi:type II secretory pathway pseudopilin PulG
MFRIKTKESYHSQAHGFTLVEVIVAGAIMIILCIGTLTVFNYAVKINRGESIRMQALSVLQQEVEYYRSLKFIPSIPGTPPVQGWDNDLSQGTHNRPQRKSADGKYPFNIVVTVTNLPAGTADIDCKFKEIHIVATPASTETGWLGNLGTDVTIQRVRAN